MTKSKSGFTIVELLIVIVVIGILAAITIVAYGGIQNRAKDTQIRQAATQVEKAILQYAVINDTTTFKGGSGSTTPIGPTGCIDGGGAGFLGSGLYTCTVEDTLAGAKLLPASFTKKIPRNPHFGAPSDNGERSIMFYPCGTSKRVLFWTLYSPPSEEEVASIAEAQATCGYGTGVRDSWGMRAAKIIQL